MTLNLRLPEQTEMKPRITVFGVGGAGGNAVNNMIEKNLQGVEFVSANTDAQALAQSRAPNRIQLGVRVTEGLGAGARPQIGSAAAEETIEEIVDHLAGVHMCFITAGMGGGTGTGAAPIIAQAARELGVLTVGVVTKPFQFEGAKRMRLAEEGVEALQRVVDTLIIIPNQNLFRLANEKTTFTEAFALADDVLYQGVKGVTDLMVRPGLMNLDFADVRSVMDEMGKAMMGTGEAEGEHRAIQAAEKAIANPLLDEISLEGARGVLINVTGGDDLTLFELDEAANLIRDKVDADANIIVGSTLDPEMQGRMRVSVVATGIDAVRGEAAAPVVRRNASAVASAPAQRRDPVAETAPEVRPAAAAASAPVAEAGEPELSLFTESDDAFADATDDLTGSIFAEDAGDEAAEDYLPPPAYHGAPVTTSTLDAPPQSFVAPKPRQPGMPAPETLERLRAAVSKVPDRAAAPAAEPRGASGPVLAAEGQRKRFGINTLIDRMTGQGPAVERPAATRREPQVAGEARGAQAEHQDERIEIPAFLRRQAN